MRDAHHNALHFFLIFKNFADEEEFAVGVLKGNVYGD
jgi:hypothetical protein